MTDVINQSEGEQEVVFSKTGETKVKISAKRITWLLIGFVAGILLMLFFWHSYLKSQDERNGTMNFIILKSELYRDGIESQSKLLKNDLRRAKIDGNIGLVKHLLAEIMKLDGKLDELTLLETRFANWGDSSAREQDNLIEDFVELIFGMKSDSGFGIASRDELNKALTEELTFFKAENIDLRRQRDSLGNAVKKLQHDYNTLSSKYSKLDKLSLAQASEIAELKRDLDLSKSNLIKADEVLIAEQKKYSAASKAEAETNRILEQKLKRLIPTILSSKFYVPDINLENGEYVLYRVKESNQVRIKMNFSGDKSLLEDNPYAKIMVKFSHPIKTSAGVKVFNDQAQYSQLKLGEEMTFTYDLNEGCYLGEYRLEIYYVPNSTIEPIFLRYENFFVHKLGVKAKKYK